MWIYAIFLLTLVLGTGRAEDPNRCMVKERSRGVLDLARNLFPNPSPDYIKSTGCGKKDKAIAFLEIATELIKDAEGNYETCQEPETKPLKNNTIKPMDCTDVLNLGNSKSGIYDIWPRTRLLNGESIRVYCDMETDGGGWTVIQRRGGFSPPQNFNQDWNKFKNGFGDLEKEFWLGNENIYYISNQGNYEVRFDLEDFMGARRYAVYKTFWIKNEDYKYRLNIENYEGNAGDSMEYDNGNVFCTNDQPNGMSYLGRLCTESRATGWWYHSCNKANINGLPNKHSKDDDYKNLYWKEWQEYKSLAKADMKLRRI